jgi:hypothetical protein
MASTALIASTILMGALLVALVVGSSRLVRGNGYEQTLKRVTPDDDDSLLSAELIGIVLTVLLVAILGVGFVLGDTSLVLFLIPILALIGYVAWGVYHMAQTRGLSTSAAVGLSAWMVGMFVAAIIGVNLLLA